LNNITLETALARIIQTWVNKEASGCV
jgi:hypothetical protein